MNICIIGVGSNIDADTNIPKMLGILGKEVHVVSVSSFLKTKPIGLSSQPDFTNGAVKIETELNPEELKTLLKQVENQLGRVRDGFKFGPRTIDLDIVAWNGLIVDDDYYFRDFLKQTVDELM